VQPTPDIFVQVTPYPIFQTTSSPFVHTTNVASVQGLVDHVDHGTATTSELDLPLEVVQRDPTGRVIFRLLDKG